MTEYEKALKAIKQAYDAGLNNEAAEDIFEHVRNAYRHLSSLHYQRSMMNDLKAGVK